MTKLNLHSVTSIDELVFPAEANELNLNSSATEFFTDFQNIEPMVINASVSAADARQMMMATHVRLKLVLNNDGKFVGVITAQDLSEQNILRYTLADKSHLEDLVVADLMSRKRDLMALDLREMQSSSIGDVVNLLKDNSQQHCLVVDEATHQIRGIFSASDISRKLRLPINIQEQSSFYRVFAAVS